MSRTNRGLAIALAAVLILSGGVAAGAFQQFTADRTATIDVVSDSNGIVAISPGSSSIVSQDADGAVTIDVTQAGASGVNVDSLLEIGDDASPSSTPALTVTNNAGSAKDITLSYALSGSDFDTNNPNVEYTVYDSTGSQIGTFAEGGSLTISSVASGSSYYVTVDVDTAGAASSNDLSGTLSVSAA